MYATFFRSLQSSTYVRQLSIDLDMLSPSTRWNPAGI